MITTRRVGPVFREGDEVVLAEGTYQGTAASAVTRWSGWPIPRVRQASVQF